MHESLLRGAGCPQSRDVAAHRASRERSGQRQQQPANPFGGQPRLRAQPLLDLLPPRGQGAGPPRRHPHRRRRPADGPPHRLDIQLQPTGDLLLRHTLHQMQVADLDPLGHPDHLRVLLARSTRRPCLATSIIARRALFPSAQGVPFQVATGSFPSCRYHALFSFLRNSAIDATNWRAEQAIRPAVVTRKVCGGNRSWRGAHTQQILTSLIRTATQRRLDPHAVIADLLRTPVPTVAPDLQGPAP